jgi:hypothetical protein
MPQTKAPATGDYPAGRGSVGAPPAVPGGPWRLAQLDFGSDLES